MKIVIKSIKVVLLVVCIGNQSLIGQIEMAKEMARSIMTQYQDSMVVKKYINHLMQDNLPLDNRPANWNYEIGVVGHGLEKLWKTTGDPQYLQYIRKIFDHFVESDGNIRTFDPTEFNIDHIPSGRQVLALYYTFNQSKYLKAVEKLKYQLEFQPRIKAGGYWHKLKYPYQMWLDGLYMGQPFTAEYAILKDDKKIWDDIAKQFLLMEKVSRDDKTGLLYHGYDESRMQKWADPTTGRSPEFWGRAMGWYILGLADVLEIFPKTHKEYKNLTAVFQRLTEAIYKYQDKTGVWWQITDKANKEGNYLESSSSAMFVAATLKGVRLNLIPESYLEKAKFGYQGLLNQFVAKDEKGLLVYKQAVSGAGLGGVPYRDGSYEYYVLEPKRDNDLKAVGPFIHASLEMEILKERNKYKGKNLVIDRFFNKEYRDGKLYHYTWDDYFDSGFSWVGNYPAQRGANLKHLDLAPSLPNLKNTDLYIIVDPDGHKDSKTPNYVKASHIQAITNYVQNGGSLLLMLNDTTNAEYIHVNKLTKAFGVEITGKNINFVKNDNYPEGDVMIAAGSEIFKSDYKLFVKELVTLKPMNPEVKIDAKVGDDAVIVSRKFGKGKVVIVGDPWIYNEYVNGRKLPVEYQNLQASFDLIDWLLAK
jgi:unsaturated rhamnogalacturonyl hydrolase